MQKNYVKAIDALRVISILGVVLIHTTTRVLETVYYDLANYKFTLFLNQLTRFSVPLFLIISGFVLEISFRKESYFAYLKRRFSKILIPYILWSLIYYFFVYTDNKENFALVLLKGGASYQLYFIPTLLIYYLAFPILHKMIGWLTDSKFKWLPGIGVILLGIVQIHIMNKDYFIHQFLLPDPVRILCLSFFFFVTGIFAAQNKDSILFFTDKSKYFLVLAVLYLANYIYHEGYNRYFKTYNIEAFYSQWRPDVLVYTLVVGSLLFYLFDESTHDLIGGVSSRSQTSSVYLKPTTSQSGFWSDKKLDLKFLPSLSKLSFLVFFIHTLILEIIWKTYAQTMFTLMNNNITEKILFDIYFFGAVSFVSFLMAYLVHKIPNASKIAG